MLATLLLAAVVSAASAAPATRCKVEIVEPVKGAAREAIDRWIADREPEDGDPHLGGYQSYLVDLDGDGKDDLVLLGLQGTGGYLDLRVLHRTKRGWTKASSPLDDAALGPAREYVDPLTHEAQPFARFCGNTYLTTLDGKPPNWSRAAWRWDGKHVRRICDASWMDEQRRAFRTLFDAKRYDEAHGFLDGAEDSCRFEMAPTTWLWMQSDLALTAHHMGTDADCLGHIAAATKGPEFAASTPSIRKALETNTELCRAGAAANPAPDFRWLLEHESDDSNQIVLDARFDRVLTAIVPDVKIDGEALRDTLKNHLFLQSNVSVTDHRYVTITGCRPHDCGSKGFAWIDTESGKSAIAVNGLIASTTISPANLPSELREEMAAAVPDLTGDGTRFVGKDGSEMKLWPLSR